MRDFMLFSQNVKEKFDNSADNMLQFGEVMMDASAKVDGKYTVVDGNNIIREQFDSIMGIDFKKATAMQRRQAWREHGKEIASLIETNVADRMNSGWNTENATFMNLVEDVNIANGDKNQFFVQDNSLLQVSQFAGDHHNVVRQAVKPGKAFSIDTSWYVIKVYADYTAFQLGNIDFAELIDRMYRSIEQYRFAALYKAATTLDESLPTDMILGTPVTEATKDAILDHIEAVRAATGKDVMLVGTRAAIQKLQSTVSYRMFSDAMKQERYENGILANWEGIEALALPRVNLPGTRDSVFSAEDNKKILILPIDPEFKPIKRVNEGDVIYTEAGMAGDKMDMTVEGDIRYQEGIGIVINQIFGEIKITA